MPEKTVKGVLLDVTHYMGENQEAQIRVFLATKKGIVEFIDRNYSPYFYVIVDDAKKRKAELEKAEFGERKFLCLKAEHSPKKNAEETIKLFFKNTDELKEAREEVKNFPFLKDRREFDIPFTKRYLIDKKLEPMNGIELEIDGKDSIVSCKAFDVQESEVTGLKLLSFDLETHSPDRFSNPAKDPVISVATSTKDGEKVFVWLKGGKKNSEGFCSNENETVGKFLDEAEAFSPEIVVTYNGDNFDLPYLKERTKKLGLDAKKAFGGSDIRIRRMGLDNAAVLSGVQHLDAYKMLRILNRFGVTSLIKFDIESVSLALFGKFKEKVSNKEINLAFETGEGMERMLDYNKEDAKTALLIAEQYLPLYVEICKLVHMTLFEASRSGASSLVEDLLLQKSFELGFLAQNRPGETEVKSRTMQSFVGGYVKEPVPGLHENIAVLDFRSLHPSIMIAHNISPETINCTHKECMNGKNVSPDGDWFCEKTKGFIPMILEDVLAQRVSAKKEMKTTDKKSKRYAFLDGKQHALKIILNSHYGYLGYPRARWYSRESAKAITAWSRHYIRDINDRAEKSGFVPIYNDTDSSFLKVPDGKIKEDVIEFVKKVNSELPQAMEIEFEGYYRRGIFVTKREGGAAKKRYALLDFNGNLKIVGFEYVRRDWAKIAKDTQKEVIQAVLEAGNPTKAIEIVREKIKLLRAGKVPKKDLIIMTQLKKPIKKYDSIGPHVAAAKKAIERGKEIEVGSTLDFIITKSGKSISDKAELEEYVKEGNYDADYYIEHQVVPAVKRIISEFGISEQDLIHGGKQHSLSSFM